GVLANSTMTAGAPYLWSYGPTCTQAVEATMDFVAKQLANKPAAFAGGSLKGQPRKFALIAPENPNYQICANEVVALAKAAGFTITDDLAYDVNASTLATQDDEFVAKMADDGDTTVLLLTDALSPLLLTDRSAEQNYDPEWVEMGVASDDTDASGQAYQQSQWAHAFGVSFLGPTVPLQQSLGYDAYTSVESDQPAISQASTAFETMQMLAIGIQMAGPDLTPQTFAKGMFAYPGSQNTSPNLNFGPWKFTPASYAAPASTWELYYNPTKTSTEDGNTGAYVVASPEIPIGSYPSGNPPFPAAFPYTPTS
ncbi:MAG TPA: ABC transporter substrate-binding protein, partial [Acidimicrobiales bacterium]